jgi:hypothetical protein
MASLANSVAAEATELLLAASRARATAASWASASACAFLARLSLTYAMTIR